MVASWRLFTVGADAQAPEGGWIAISGDGASTFSAPIRLPVPALQASESQFYQPLLGRDPGNGHRMLYVILRTQSAGNAIAMHVVKADIDGVSGTSALESRLKDPLAWTFLPSRISGLTAYGASGYDGSFRFGSYFMPAIDSSTGRLFAVVHALDPVTRRAQTLISDQLFYDYDNGTFSRDALGNLLEVSNLGLGGSEGMITPGDSGGGLFVQQGDDWLLAGINSFTTRWPATDSNLIADSSLGEIAGATQGEQLYRMDRQAHRAIPDPKHQSYRSSGRRDSFPPGSGR